MHALRAKPPGPNKNALVYLCKHDHCHQTWDSGRGCQVPTTCLDLWLQPYMYSYIRLALSFTYGFAQEGGCLCMATYGYVC